MTTILAIDPGPEKSGWVLFDGEPQGRGITENEILVAIGDYNDSLDGVVIEMTESRGMPVGTSVHETTFWVGQFYRAALGRRIRARLYRREVKMHLCGSMRAKDSNIRQAMIDRWGGKEKAIGKKKTPGPLYGITSHMMQALALAVTWWDLNVATKE